MSNRVVIIDCICIGNGEGDGEGDVYSFAYGKFMALLWQCYSFAIYFCL